MSVTAQKILSGGDLKALSVRSDLLGTLRLGMHLALIGLFGWLVAISGPWTVVPAMALLGIGLATLFAPIHETMHLTAFASRRANVIVGWLVACPSLLNWHFYTAFHLAHHRNTQDPDHDPELAALPTPKTIQGYIIRASAIPYWRARLMVARDAWRGDMSSYPFIIPRVAPKIIASVRLMTLFVGACVALSIILVGWWAPLVFWLGPQLLGQPFLRLYLLTEHTGCTLDANGLTNTRTTLTNGVVRLLLWNMSFHTEHHLYPSIPFHRLPAAHGVMRDRLGVVQRGYVRWHVGFVRSLRCNRVRVG